MKKEKQTGFTLLELMIVIGIVAIMAALAAPSLARTYQNQQLEGSKDLFLRHLKQARLEAMNRGERVALCSANAAQDNCDLAPNAAPATAPARFWGSGWIMFIDRNANGVVGDVVGERIIQQGTTFPKDVGIWQRTIGANGQLGYIGYDSSGRGFGLPGAGAGLSPTVATRFCLADRRFVVGVNERFYREVSLDTFGRVFDLSRTNEQSGSAIGAGGSECVNGANLCAQVQADGRSVCRREV